MAHRPTKAAPSRAAPRRTTRGRSSAPAATSSPARRAPSSPAGIDQVTLDSVVLARFLRALGPGLRAFFEAFQTPSREIEDIMECTILTLLYRGDQFFSATAWFLATVRRRCLQSWHQRTRRSGESLSIDPALLDPLAPLPVEEFPRVHGAELREALFRLPSRAVTVLVQWYLDERPVAEIAPSCGCHPRTVRRILQRSREPLPPEPEPAGKPQTRRRPASKRGSGRTRPD